MRKCADDMISEKRKKGKKERGKGTVCLAYDISYVCSRCARVQGHGNGSPRHRLKNNAPSTT